MCQKCRKEIIQELRKKVNRESKKRLQIKLPSKMDFCVFKNTNTIAIRMPSRSVLVNMQNDEAAFEGWILALRYWTKYKNFTLTWDRPRKAKKSYHYQRFLYRAYRFHELFKDWFDMDIALLSDSGISFVKGENAKENYILNYPSKQRPSTIQKRMNKENKLEIRFVNKDKKALLNIINIDENTMNRQLPIGLFRNKVSNDNRIFTGGKSAIDIWGMDKDKTTLHIFELKAEKNQKVGVVSEIFFYTMVMDDLLNNRIKYSQIKPANLRNFDSKEAFLVPENFKSIRAYILAPSLHPLIRETMLQPLNDALKEKAQFGCIKFRDEGEALICE